MLGGVGAVEVQDVLAALALDGVAAVARIPLEVVGAAAQLRGVGAEVAVDEVVAGAADEHVIAVATGERVVAGAAVDREPAQRRDAVAAGDHVVAGAGLHVDGREGAASKLKAGTPLTDTCSVPGAPSCRASVSLAASPVICSVPACTCAV